ncbi:dehydration-responsive element-binding protein 1E-like [Oryza brachyantha]|uniref:dehydration-responsive element-binding protein 1E-like n=1 Tax=Oryza brachyantha TaxID=4533 RepID=UPI001ADB2048|nr:dehydration-responsive element-binding protein 1E-like [Oryza brachyantha]
MARSLCSPSRGSGGAAAAGGDLPGPSPSSERMGRAAAATKKGSRLRPFVYQRQPGRWGVEFRDRHLDIRKWLGTHDSKEEAMAAYDAYEARVDAALACGEVPPGARRARPPTPDVKVHQRPARRAPGRPRKQQPPPAAAAAATTTSSASLSSEEAATPLSSSSAAVEAPALTPQNPLPLAVDPFRGEEDLLANDHRFGFGLADIGHLPLPSFHANVDFSITDSDLSLFDAGFM